jgi:hypothetical protein
MPETEISELDAVTVWRPVGPLELELIKKANMRAFPPRLPDQPIFYAVLSEEYAVKIARDWNVPASGSGFVTRFQVRRSFLDNYSVQKARRLGSPGILDPCGRYGSFNQAIVGEISVDAEFS